VIADAIRIERLGPIGGETGENLTAEASTDQPANNEPADAVNSTAPQVALSGDVQRSPRRCRRR
jgi:hypothetical protein